MSARHRSVLFAAALAAGIALVTVAGADVAGAQVPTFGSTTSTTSVEDTSQAPSGASTEATDVDDTSTDDANQSRVSAPEPVETALFTESRKIMAIIGALVCVAILLAILTIRYARRTKPFYVEGSAVVDEDLDPVAPAPVGVDPSPSVEVPIAEPPSADHHGADHDWEPRTGEHQRVEASTGGAARPSAAARRAVLGGGADPGGAPVASDHG